MSRKLPDFDLWLEAAKSVKPFHHRASRTPPATDVKKPVLEVRKSHLMSAVPYNHGSLSVSPTPPPITGLDRRTAQKLTRGIVEIERRLDLHGTGVDMARMRLHKFLCEAQAEGLRTVLVITGKGESPYTRHTLHGTGHFHSPERAGRLRRFLPEWLHDAEFRALVSGFQPAHPRHGGGGAFYVRIRRTRGHG